MKTPFTTIRTEGGLLPADLLQRIASSRDISGLKPGDYHLAANERLNEAISRSWNRLLGVWQSFDDQRRKLTADDSGVTLTRERWLLILFQELGYGRLTFTRKGLETDDGDRYPISHVWEHTPIHLITFRQDLDRRDPTIKRTPHGMMQEFLNRSSTYLWGFLSNGLRLRILRDNASLSRAAYVEFDMEGMMRGEVYADFVVLWLVAHQSRVEVGESGDPADCWLERWMHEARETGARALDALRDGVQDAIAHLGRGFLAWKRGDNANRHLREHLRTGELSAQDYYRQLLRLVYRLIFLFVAEDRNLLLAPDASPQARERYMTYYSGRRLRHLAAARRGGPHPDLYRTLRLVFHLLQEGYKPLGLPGLGGFLFSEEATPDLNDLDITNRDLLQAIRSLAFVINDSALWPVDFRNLGSEELGSVYESLLELHPQLDLHKPAFELSAAAGSERKTTGSYYTPASLINELLDSALEPVIRDRLASCHPGGNVTLSEAKGLAGQETRDSSVAALPQNDSFDSVTLSETKGLAGDAPRDSLRLRSGQASPSAQNDSFDSVTLSETKGLAGQETRDSSVAALPQNDMSPEEAAILSIKVIDPASGSGHFLIAAAHRLAAHLARVRNQDQEPSPAAHRAALRDVIRRCIYGVDVNPMAVELCKVGLWLESLDPGKPLTFLDRNIQCGNSLVGVTPELDISVIPDNAFKPVTGDDSKTASALRRRNKRERQGQLAMFESFATGKGIDELEQEQEELTARLAEVEDIAEEDLADVALKAMYYQDYLNAPAYRHKKDVYDLWTAAFFWPIPAGDAELMPAPTQAVLSRLRQTWNPDDPVVQQARAIAAENQFFHWELAFPTVFNRGKQGFDVVLGNPPWERIKLQEKEWFATSRPDIANAPNRAARQRLIKALEKEYPDLYQAFQKAKARAENTSQFVRNSGAYPLCGRGDVNTYAIFAELDVHLMNAIGRTGVIVPTGIATDDTTKYFFQALMTRRSLVSLYDFENRKALFPGVHRSYKFCLLTLTGPDHPARQGADFVFFALDVSDLRDAYRHFTLTAEDIELINPNTRTCPIFRSKRDAELTKAIYRRVPVLIMEEEKDDQGRVIRPEQNPWGVKFSTMFHMSNDSHLFRTREELEAAGYRLVGNRFVRPVTLSAAKGLAGQEMPDSLRPRSGQTSASPQNDREDVYLPLYEAKMTHIFDHRAADVVLSKTATARQGQPRPLTSAEHRNAGRLAIPRYWVHKGVIWERLNSYRFGYLLGFSDVTASTNERTMLATLLPIVGVGHTMPLIFPSTGVLGFYLLANFNSFVFDFNGRQKIGGLHYTYFIFKQLPVLPPANYAQPCPWWNPANGEQRIASGDAAPPPLTTHHSPLTLFLLPRVLELTYTAWDLAPFGRDVITHWQNQVASGQWGVPPGETDPATLRPVPHASSTMPLFPPYRWDEDRRFLMRCELDAAYFHLYGIARDDVAYIMDTFPIVKRKDEAAHGDYRTKRVILEIYDAMARAIETGDPYRTRLDPPPGHPSQTHTGPPPEWVA